MPCYVTGGVFPVAQALRMPLPKCSYLTQVPPNGLAGGRKNVKTRAEAAGGHPGREDERYGAPSRSPSASPQKLRDRPWGRQLLRSERGLSFYIFNTKPCFLNSNKVLEQTTKALRFLKRRIKLPNAPGERGLTRLSQSLTSSGPPPPQRFPPPPPPPPRWAAAPPALARSRTRTSTCTPESYWARRVGGRGGGRSIKGSSGGRSASLSARRAEVRAGGGWTGGLGRAALMSLDTC